MNHTLISGTDMIINELGQLVPAVGNPLSPARMKAQFPETYAKLLKFAEHRGITSALFGEFMFRYLPKSDQEVRDAIWRTLQTEKQFSTQL